MYVVQWYIAHALIMTMYVFANCIWICISQDISTEISLHYVVIADIKFSWWNQGGGTAILDLTWYDCVDALV